MLYNSKWNDLKGTDIMKKFRLICTILAFAVALSACSDKPSEDRTDETEETESQVLEDEDIRPVSEDELEGIWLNENGFVCEFDLTNNIFIDSYGVKYSIVSIDDYNITILSTFDDYYLYMEGGVPIGNTITLDAHFNSDSLVILNQTSYNSNSDEGEELSSNIEDRLAGNTFNLNGLAAIELDNDLTTMTVTTMYGQTEANFTYDGGKICVPEEDVSIVMWTTEDGLVWVSNGTIGYSTSDVTAVPTEWLLYDAEEEELTELAYDKNGGPTYADSPYAPVISTEMGDFVSIYAQPGVYVEGEVMAQNSSTSTSDALYILDMRSPYAQAMLTRQEVIESDRGQRSEHTIEFDEGYITVEAYDNQWLDELCCISPYGYDVPDTSVDGRVNVYVSDVYYIDIEDDAEPELTFFYDGDSSDDVSIYRFGESTYDEPQIINTSFGDGTASAFIDQSGTYFLGTVNNPGGITPDNYFEIDPEDTPWAATGDTGDIIPLVDLEYIEMSYQSVFIIDSIEDLASFTYFINTYPRVYDYQEMFWADLTEDIDLTGYEWAPIGIDSNTAFAGIFAGNGHTITGLTISNQNSAGFFGHVTMATIFGINIEDAYIEGNNSAIMAYSMNLTDFYDCHVSGTLPDNVSESTSLFPLSVDYGNNGYMDCSMEITNAGGETFEEEIAGGLPRPNEMNELYELFDPEHDGTYDYSEDYFFG